MDDSNKSSNGPLVGAIIVILVLVAGAIYLLTLKTTEKEKPVAPVPTLIAPPEEDLSNIEAGLSDTALESLDADLSDLENEVTAE